MSGVYDVIVLGGGPSGVTAALRARELGATVALIERDQLGGICLNDGVVPTRVLARAARLVRDARQFPAYGLHGTAPEIDVLGLLERVRQTVETVHYKKHLREHLRAAGVVVFDGAGEACFLDPHTLVLPAGQRLEGERFIICVGGQSRRLDVPGNEHALSYRDIWTLERLPRSLVIVGGAATGCQLASIFTTFGCEVTLLETGPRLMGRADPLIGAELEQSFARHGIQVVCGIAGIERIEGRAGERVVHFTHAGAQRALSCDAVLLAVGWVGNITSLGLETAGVECQRGYIVVDDTLRTSAPHIFAAGDVTGRVMLVQSGSHEGRIAAENAVLGTRRAHALAVVPHGGFTDPEYGSVGLSEDEARALHDCVVAVVPYSDLDRAVIDGVTHGACKLIVARDNGRLLGAHVVGAYALEIVQVVAAGMAASMEVSQLADLEIAYPTYTAILGLAARQMVRELGRVDLAPSWRALSRLRAIEWERSDTLRNRNRRGADGDE
ncbi:MAG: dihydrolipoyl dehydrogenase family protein [Chloroflexaceae bacterium]